MKIWLKIKYTVQQQSIDPAYLEIALLFYYLLSPPVTLHCELESVWHVDSFSYGF